VLAVERNIHNYSFWRRINTSSLWNATVFEVVKTLQICSKLLLYNQITLLVANKYYEETSRFNTTRFWNLDFISMVTINSML